MCVSICKDLDKYFRLHILRADKRPFVLLTLDQMTDRTIDRKTGRRSQSLGSRESLETCLPSAGRDGLGGCGTDELRCCVGAALGS